MFETRRFSSVCYRNMYQSEDYHACLIQAVDAKTCRTTAAIACLQFALVSVVVDEEIADVFVVNLQDGNRDSVVHLFLARKHGSV